MTTAPVPDATGQTSGAEAASRVARLFESHGRMIYGVCRAMLRDTHEAEDATQQTFLSAHRSLLGGARVRDEGAWLATIARNECRGRIAAAMRTPLPISDDELAAIPAPADEADRSAQAEALRDALADLPERQREAVVLRDLYGLRYSEVATALGISRPATEALLFRARRAMRQRLRPLVATVLTVPLSVQEGLAQAIPGFGTSGSGAVAAGAAGGGILVKLTAGPVAAKFATAAVAVATVGTVGTVGTVESERAGRDRDNNQANITTVASQRGKNEDSSGLGSGSRLENDDNRVGSSDPGNREESDDDGDNSGPGSGGDEDSSGSGSGDSGETERGDGGSDDRGGGGGSSGRQGPSSGEGDGPDSSGSGSGDSGKDEPDSSDG